MGTMVKFFGGHLRSKRNIKYSVVEDAMDLNGQSHNPLHTSWGRKHYIPQAATICKTQRPDELDDDLFHIQHC